MNEKEKRIADAAYRSSIQVARDLLSQIDDMIKAMPAPGTDDRLIHFGHVTDIHNVNSLLLQVVSAIDTGRMRR